MEKLFLKNNYLDYKFKEIIENINSNFLQNNVSSNSANIISNNIVDIILNDDYINLNSFNKNNLHFNDFIINSSYINDIQVLFENKKFEFYYSDLIIELKNNLNTEPNIIEIGLEALKKGTEKYLQEYQMENIISLIAYSQLDLLVSKSNIEFYNDELDTILNNSLINNDVFKKGFDISNIDIRNAIINYAFPSLKNELSLDI